MLREASFECVTAGLVWEEFSLRTSSPTSKEATSPPMGADLLL